MVWKTRKLTMRLDEKLLKELENWLFEWSPTAPKIKNKEVGEYRGFMVFLKPGSPTGDSEITAFGRKGGQVIPATGATKQEAVQNVKNKIDEYEESNIQSDEQARLEQMRTAKRIQNNAAVDFNVEFGKKAEKSMGIELYGAIIPGPKLIISTEPKPGLKYLQNRASDKHFGNPMFMFGISGRRAEEADLIEHGRYLLVNEVQEDENTYQYDLEFHSIAQHKKDTLQLGAPGLTVASRIDKIRPNIVETATGGATSAANIATVDAPQLSPGLARGKRSYTGSPYTGSGTKAPPQPKPKRQKPSDNALDMNTNIFGTSGKTIKRR